MSTGPLRGAMRTDAGGRGRRRDDGDYRLDERIDKMHREDRQWALFALVSLWAIVAFVFYKMLSLTGDPAVVVALAVGGALLLLLNTASIFVMLGHFAEDKDQIYGLDIHYLDARRPGRR